MDKADPVSLGRSSSRAFVAVGRHPSGTLRATRRLVGGLAGATVNTTERMLGRTAPAVLEPAPKDARFADRAWSENAWFAGLLEAYLVTDRFSREVVESAELEEPAAAKARFAARLMADALAPTNLLATNPAALRRAFETGGAQRGAGLRNFLRDLRTNGGWPRQVDTPAVRARPRTWRPRRARSSTATTSSS